MSDTPMSDGVHAVIVTFHPDLPMLGRVLAAVKPQVTRIVIVDNGSTNAALENFCGGYRDVRLLRLPQNRGLAAGQNEGIATAIGAGASHVLLLDQDSVPQPQMVERLREALDKLEQERLNVAAVGPRFRVDASGAISSFKSLGLIGLRSVTCCSEQGIVASDFLISSGMLISARSLEEIGLMDEGLFIDQVDTEWCLRARSHGFRLFGVCAALLDHTLGEEVLNVWFWRWRRVHCHKPFRYYFIFRNTLLLFRRKYAPLRWCLYEVWHLFGLVAFCGLIGRDGKSRFKMMKRGVLDGVRGTMGPLQLP
jgi:rhamnosyltransferase